MREHGIFIVNYPNFIRPELQQYEGLWELYSQLKQKRYWSPQNVFKRGPLLYVKLEGKTPISILSLEIRENCLNLNYPENVHVYQRRGKGKTIPAQDCSGPNGSRSFRFPEFLDNLHMKVARLSALSTGRVYPLGDILITHFY